MRAQHGGPSAQEAGTMEPRHTSKDGFLHSRDLTTQYPPEGLPSPPDRLRGNSVGKSVKARRLLPGPGSRSARLRLASEKSPRPHL